MAVAVAENYRSVFGHWFPVLGTSSIEAQIIDDCPPPFPKPDHMHHADGSISMPLRQYPLFFRSHTPEAIGILIEDLTNRVTQGSESIAVGSGPSNALNRIVLVEKEHGLFRHDISEANLPTIIGIWATRLSEGNAFPGSETKVKSVMDMIIRGGADFDCKTLGLDVEQGFYGAIESLSEYYESVKIIPKQSNSRAHSAILTIPRFPDIHESQRYLSGKFTHLMVRNRNTLTPMVTVYAGPIPVAPHLNVISVDIRASDASGKLTTPNYSMHFTPRMTDELDFRLHPDLNSHHARVYAHLVSATGQVVFPSSAVRAHRESLTFPSNMTEVNAAFATQTIIRGLRLYLLSQFRALPDAQIKSFFRPINLIPRQDYERTRTYADLIDPESIEAIKMSIDYIAENTLEISDQMKTEMIAEIAASALNKPIDIGMVLHDTRLYTLFQGFEGLNQADIIACVQIVHVRLSHYFNDHPEKNTYENMSVMYEQCLEKSDFPYYMNFDKNISLTSLPDGMSLWVEALEEVRSAKGLPILGNHYSIASRFCEYFCIK